MAIFGLSEYIPADLICKELKKIELGLLQNMI